MDVLKAELSRMRETFTENARLWSRVSGPLMAFGRDGGRVQGRSGQWKGQGWKRQRGPCGQECLSGAQEVLRRPVELVGKVRGKQDVEPERQRGGEKEEGTEPGGKKHPVMPKKNRKSFKGLNQEGQHLLGWTMVGKRGRAQAGTRRGVNALSSVVVVAVKM